jgi:hypothetical protein
LCLRTRRMSCFSCVVLVAEDAKDMRPFCWNNAISVNEHDDIATGERRCAIRRSPSVRFARFAPAVQRERAALRYGPARASKHWILEASNILAGMKKALHLCKALIVLAFLAPRPGLQPGTYGLTGGRSDRAAGRAKAHFQGVRTSNTFASVSSISTGRELRIDYWILESSPPRMPGCSAVLFLDLGMAADSCMRRWPAR